MATAIRASVTVSMADDTNGSPGGSARLIRAAVSASAGNIAECAGQQQHIVEGQRLGGELGVSSVMAPSATRRPGATSSILMSARDAGTTAGRLPRVGAGPPGWNS